MSLRTKSDTAVQQSGERLNGKKTWKKDLTKNWPMYVMFIPVFAYFLIFCYLPMQGVVIAFKDYNLRQGIWGSDWTLDNFAKLFGDPQAFNALRNTMAMAFLNLTIGFLFPVIFRNNKVNITDCFKHFFTSFVAMICFFTFCCVEFIC